MLSLLLPPLQTLRFRRRTARHHLLLLLLLPPSARAAGGGSSVTRWHGASLLASRDRAAATASTTVRPSSACHARRPPAAIPPHERVVNLTLPSSTDNFTDHPLAPSKDPNFVHEWDQHPGLILPTRPTLFSSITFAADRRAFVNVSPDHVLGVEIRSTSDDDNDNDKESLVPVFAGESHLTRADRRLRLQLRKFPCNEEEEAVRRFEIMIISFVTESLGNAAHKDIVRAPSLDERSIDSIQSLESVDSDDLWDAPETHDLDNGWIRLDARGPTDAAESPALASEPSVPGEMRLVLTDSFLRLLVHTVCRYYMLVSFSKDMPDGQRVTYIRNPHAMGNGRRHASNYNLPAVSFSDFIFA
ncbi:hypothetical protein BC831DRAFT_447168 [Entophlyctis helioformis]|nr:hypothetical protein BC831DRAFT_447168 [Entophlyctis helioformis]